jgi:anti-anti-sigma factor
LVIKIRTGPGEIVVCPMGDLDLAASVHFRGQIHKLLQPGLKVIIDLVHTRFIDAAGLSAISESVRQVRALGGTTLITNASPRQRWLLKLMGADRLVGPVSVTSRLGAA